MILWAWCSKNTGTPPISLAQCWVQGLAWVSELQTEVLCFLGSPGTNIKVFSSEDLPDKVIFIWEWWIEGTWKVVMEPHFTDGWLGQRLTHPAKPSWVCRLSELSAGGALSLHCLLLLHLGWGSGGTEDRFEQCPKGTFFHRYILKSSQVKGQGLQEPHLEKKWKSAVADAQCLELCSD